MKCETRDVNVTERVNDPKFSKLDNTVTPFTFLELFFDYVLVDIIVGFPKYYSHREKPDINFEITNETFRYLKYA